VAADAGPTKPTGEARSLKIGSVSTFSPPACTSSVAWPIQVAVGTIAVLACALACRKAVSAATIGVGWGMVGGFSRRAVNQRSKSPSDLLTVPMSLLRNPVGV